MGFGVQHPSCTNPRSRHERVTRGGGVGLLDALLYTCACAFVCARACGSGGEDAQRKIEEGREKEGARDQAETVDTATPRLQ